MSLPIHVTAYSGYRANERPRDFSVDEDLFEIAEVEDRWYEPDAMYFRVRTTQGTRVSSFDIRNRKTNGHCRAGSMAMSCWCGRVSSWSRSTLTSSVGPRRKSNRASVVIPMTPRFLSIGF